MRTEAAADKAGPPTSPVVPKVSVSPSVATDRMVVRRYFHLMFHQVLIHFQHKMAPSNMGPLAPGTSSQGYLIPPPPPILTGSSSGDRKHRSIGRGDLDETIKSMRRGVRRERTVRPLSKMFLDGN